MWSLKTHYNVINWCAQNCLLMMASPERHVNIGMTWVILFNVLFIGGSMLNVLKVLLIGWILNWEPVLILPALCRFQSSLCIPSTALNLTWVPRSQHLAAIKPLRRWRVDTLWYTRSLYFPVLSLVGLSLLSCLSLCLCFFPLALNKVTLWMTIITQQKLYTMCNAMMISDI